MAITTNYTNQQFYYQLKELILQMKLEEQAKKEKVKYKVKEMGEFYQYYKSLLNTPPVKKISKQAVVDFPELNDVE